MMYRDIQDVRTGSGTANSKWECREKLIGSERKVINASWLQNALQREENVAVKAIILVETARLIIALILLTIFCHISFRFIRMFYDDSDGPLCSKPALSFM